jgi:hypothetical protein
MYQLHPGVFGDFYAYWKDNIVPAREANGFTILSAWRDVEANGFIWVVRWNGEGSFEDADAAYYDSPERSKLPKAFGQYIASSEVRMIETIDPFVAQR